MAGSPKRRIRFLREQGADDMADWLEAREVARAKGIRISEWLKSNPKPEDPTDSTELDKEIRRINDKSSGLPMKQKVKIPDEQLATLEKIRASKDKLKEQAHKAAKSGNETELKTVYKVLKRLDAEEKQIIFRYDFEAFDEYMFQDLQDRVATAPFHFEMVDLYNQFKRACVVCPRGHAKSTTARKYLLHQILYKEVGYVIIVGASEDMAAQNLRWVRDQLIDNKRVTEVYGYLKDKDKWADSKFQTSTGIKVVAKGAGQKIRGENEKGRPDLIYIDDLEEDEQVSSRDRREKLRKWFSEALMPAKSRNGRIIITGTILHLDSLLKNISENKVGDHIDWKVLWYAAIQMENGEEKALWPEHKPLDELRALREKDPETFAQEYQNNPTSGAMAVFKRDEYQYISQEDIYIDQASKTVYVKNRPVHVLLTPDLALSEREGADYTVLMVTGMCSEGNLYVLEYERFRSADPYEQIDMIFEMSSKWYCEMITMETVAFQKTFKRVMEREMEKRSMYFYVHEISRQAIRKIFRIKSLKGPIRTKSLFWQRDHYDLEEELSQVTVTSLGTHDDVIDALADAWEVQLEIYEESEGPRIEVNSVAWAINEGLLPTELEREEMAAYGY